MKKKISEQIEIPSGILCEISDKMLICKKGSVELKKDLNIPNVNSKISGNNILLECSKGNKNEYKIVKSYISHLKNLFSGFESKYKYELEEAHVHFPMTMKVEGKKFMVNNFLGEKTPRHAAILPDVNVEVKGNKIFVSSSDKEAAGQTAANIEKATKIRGRDRRVFQDGIYITEKGAAQ